MRVLRPFFDTSTFRPRSFSRSSITRHAPQGRLPHSVKTRQEDRYRCRGASRPARPIQRARIPEPGIACRDRPTRPRRPGHPEMEHVIHSCLSHYARSCDAVLGARSGGFASGVGSRWQTRSSRCAFYVLGYKEGSSWGFKSDSDPVTNCVFSVPFKPLRTNSAGRCRFESLLTSGPVWEPILGRTDGERRIGAAGHSAG